MIDVICSGANNETSGGGTLAVGCVSGGLAGAPQPSAKPMIRIRKTSKCNIFIFTSASG